MKWTKREEEYIKENYPKNVPLLEISKKIRRSKRAIQHKAARLEISRPRFLSNRSHKRMPRKIIEKRYYEKHKERIYRKKMERRKILKEEAVKLLGNKCFKCGYDKCITALDFHHDKGKKENMVALLIKNSSRQKVLKEVKKCILLCANCHREVHNLGA